MEIDGSELNELVFDGNEGILSTTLDQLTVGSVRSVVLHPTAHAPWQPPGQKK
jgi:hypothetical protein